MELKILRSGSMPPLPTGMVSYPGTLGLDSPMCLNTPSAPRRERGNHIIDLQDFTASGPRPAVANNTPVSHAGVRPTCHPVPMNDRDARARAFSSLKLRAALLR